MKLSDLYPSYTTQELKEFLKNKPNRDGVRPYSDFGLKPEVSKNLDEKIFLRSLTSFKKDDKPTQVIVEDLRENKRVFYLVPLTHLMTYDVLLAHLQSKAENNVKPIL